MQLDADACRDPSTIEGDVLHCGGNTRRDVAGQIGRPRPPREARPES